MNYKRRAGRKTGMERDEITKSTDNEMSTSSADDAKKSNTESGAFRSDENPSGNDSFEKRNFEDENLENKTFDSEDFEGNSDENLEENFDEGFEEQDTDEDSQKKFIKSKNDFFKGFLFGSLITIIIITLLFSTVVQGNITGANTDSKFNEIKDIIKQRYLYGDEVKRNNLNSGMYKGYVMGLGDPYSEYYSAEEYRALKEATSGHFYGIGAVFRLEDGKVKVMRTYENSPARQGGIEDGDELLEVNGKSVNGRKLQDISGEIKGDKDTKVTLKLYRSKTGKTFEKTLVRKDIVIESVSYKMLSNRIGYIKISEFTAETFNQYQKAVAELEKRGMKALIVDLRNNPGGVIKSTAQILDSILPGGKIVYTKDKYGHINTWNSDEAHKFTKPMAVLINGYSASASEIFAGAIQDYKKGPIIGEKSYGKGIVQQIIDLKDGSGIKLTVSEYYTPNGRRLHKVGVNPDIEVKAIGDGSNQLERAVTELKKRIR